MSGISSHEVTYGDPDGQHRVIVREAFIDKGRFLGTEYVTVKWYEGSMEGWKWYTESPTTVAFATGAELGEWIDDLYRQHDIALVKASGGTKLVVLT